MKTIKKVLSLVKPQNVLYLPVVELCRIPMLNGCEIKTTLSNLLWDKSLSPSAVLELKYKGSDLDQ